MARKKYSEVETAVASLASKPANTTARITLVKPEKAVVKPRARKKTIALEAANGTAGLSELAEAIAHHSADERDDVALRAYFRWLERGCPAGSAEEDWLSAEREVQEV